LISAVIVAGGKGTRMGQDINKQYIKIENKEILARTLEVFQAVDLIDEIILVVPEGDINFCKKNVVDKYNINKVMRIVTGGAERQNSVYNGLLNCSPDTSIVLIHDGARPFVTKDIIEKSIESAKEFGACAAAVPVKDTIKVANGEGFIIDTPNRSALFAVQTPQTFKYDLILKAHEEGMKKGIYATDDTMLVESLGHRVKIVEGSYFNIKITTPEDLTFAEAIIEKFKGEI
jgi:2-C-methyl-D-erythritol 4-phosphate cytidylyltransferase